MKYLTIFFVQIIFVFKPDLTDIRVMYRNAHNSQKDVLALYQKLESIVESDEKVLVAYKGASIAMLAKYEKGTKQKTEKFKRGVALVEYAIVEDPDNIEIRFIRLSVQQNSPKVLKYKSNIEVDKNFILSNYSNIRSSGLKNYLKHYILHSNNFTEEEKNVISHP